MAHGWDSYFDNLSALTSDSDALRRTSETEGSLSHHIENFIGHNDFPDTVASQEVPATNSEFHTNYYSNPSGQNSRSDCVYQTYSKETPWQADGGQINKGLIPKCGNTNMDFATDGSSASTFVPSFPGDLQGLKQDYGMLPTSFLEDYSDVSSCSDTDAGEMRPSCKFMAGKSLPKAETDVTMKQSSSEWIVPETSDILPSPSGVTTRDNLAEFALDKIQCSESTAKSRHHLTSCNVVMSTRSATVDSKEEQNTGATSNFIRVFNNDKGQLDEKGTKELVIQESKGCTVALEGESKERGPSETENSAKQIAPDHSCTDSQDGIMSNDKQNESEIANGKIKGSDSSEREHFDRQIPQNTDSLNGQHEYMETDCQEREMHSNTSQPLGFDSKDAAYEMKDRSSTLKNKNPDHGSYLQLPLEESSEKLHLDDVCQLSAVSCEKPFKDASGKNEQTVARHLSSVLALQGSSRDVSSNLECERTAPKEKASNTTSVDPDCNDAAVTDDSIDACSKGKQGMISPVESCLLPRTIDTDINPCPEKQILNLPEIKTPNSPKDPDCNDSVLTSDNSDKSASDTVELYPQSDIPSPDANLCHEKEYTSPAENTGRSFSPDPQQSQCMDPMALQLDSQSGDVTENAREPFEELDRSPVCQEPSELGLLYGEPLSREDSLCETDTKFDNQYEDMSLDRPDCIDMSHLKRQALKKTSLIKMRKQLQPVVLIKTSESINKMNKSYHCGSCEHTTHSFDHLIEHHHRCHSVFNVKFCKMCSLYLLNSEQAKKHLCSVKKKKHQLPSDSSLKNEKGRHKCSKCKLRFQKFYLYIKHMRLHTGKTPYLCKGCGRYFAQGSSLRRHMFVPGRCKQSNVHLKSNAVITETKTPLKQDLVPTIRRGNLRRCYVKVFDISKMTPCVLCGKKFSTAVKAKKHFINKHHRKNLTANHCTTKPDVCKVAEESQRVDIEPTGKYECPLCPRFFKYSYNRARHLRDCVKERIFGGKGKINGKYQCPLCCATFTLSSNRYRHIKAVCLKDCLMRLSKEREKSRQRKDEKKTTEVQSKETECKAQPKETEYRMQSKTKELKLQSRANELTTLSQEDEHKKEAATDQNHAPRYKCSLCPAVFYHASGKYRHMKKHELFKSTGKIFRYRNSVFSMISKPASSRNTKSEDLKDDSSEDSRDDLKVAGTNSSLNLSCHFCGKGFTSSQSLKRHEHHHRGERPYSCLECGKRFKRRAYLIGHKRVHQRRIQCTVCRKILPTITELIQHRSSHLKRGMLQCPDCYQQFKYPAHLLRHYNSHRKREKKQLKRAQRQQSKPEQAWEPEKEESEPTQIQCSLCKEVFADSQELRTHCLKHISRSSSNQCPFCKHNFRQRRYLLKHMLKHTGEPPYCCTNCGRRFYRGIYLELHSQRCLPVQTVPVNKTEIQTETETTPRENDKPKTMGSLMCSYCPRLFSKKIRLKNHHLGHKANTLLPCSKCGWYFGSTKLNQHQKKNCTGTGLNVDTSTPNGDQNSSQTSQNVRKVAVKSSTAKILPLKCPHCKQRFRFKSLLLRHSTTHTGLQPYACARCGQRFRSQTLCLKHETFCDAVSKEDQSNVKSDAAKQLTDMSGPREPVQKPQTQVSNEYKCKFCTKTFMKARNLRRHILTHNEVKPYRCKACDSCFSRYDHLKVHQARCKGRKSRLEVCIPKISLDDVGTGWQTKFAIEQTNKPETFKCISCSRTFPTQSKLSRHHTLFHAVKLFSCSGCGASFSHEKSLKQHRKIKKCRRASIEINRSVSEVRDLSTKNDKEPLDERRNRILQRIQPCFNRKYKYTCSYCPRTFGKRSQLDVHISLHTGARPHTCSHCGKKFIRKDHLQRHYTNCIKKSLPKKVLCDRCGGFFPQVELEIHRKSCISTPSSSESTVCNNQQSSPHNQPKGFPCAYCSSRFLLFSQLQEHFVNAHKMETMTPPVSTAPLQHHLSSISNIKEEPLDESYDQRIGESTNLICKLDEALEMEVQKSFTCTQCNSSFGNKAGLIGHQCAHTTQALFKCETCNRGFWTKKLLRNHFRKCRFGHISEGKTTENLDVPLKAQIDFALNDSVLVFKEGSDTTGTGVLQANFSHKEDVMAESQQNSTTNAVQSSSSKDKKKVQYQCSECDESFTDGLMLISHLEDHGREEQEKKNNTCSKCGRSFSSQTHLEKHKKMHEVYEQISCPHCPKTFCSVSDLEAHKKCHDKRRTFVCKLCNERFWTGPSLCNHYSEDHPNDVYTCRFCNKTYSVKKSLSRHYKKWHQKELKELRSSVQEVRGSEQQCSSQVSITGESDESDSGSEDSGSDSAPYFPCHVCGKTFPTSESLEDHQRCHLGEKPHECEECGRCFYQASQLQQHQRMHKSEFQCQACGRGFVSLFALRKHKHTHGKSRPYRCFECQLSFPGPSQLAEHMSIHREENFPCDICDRVFRSKSSRAEHRKSHTKTNIQLFFSPEEPASTSENSLTSNKELKYRCGVCSERFTDPENLSEHGCMAAKERPYSCLDCNKHFLHASHLKKHRANHHLSWSGGKFPCDQCNPSSSPCKHFRNNPNSQADPAAGPNCNIQSKHERPSEDCICPVCHLGFASFAEFISHFPVHTAGIFECKICKITFASGSELKEHECRPLTSATEFECTECGQSFLGREAFSQHRCSLQKQSGMENKYSTTSSKVSPLTYRHARGEEEEIDVTGEDFFYCPICLMHFSSKSSLLEHQNKQHPNEKPFKCELCGKTFALRRYLKAHEQRHCPKSSQNPTQFAEKELRCTQCSATFSIAQDLSEHLRLHAEKQVGKFRCDMCYKSFSHWAHLKQHQESHVGQVVYECNECDKAFAFPHLLEEHQQSHAASTS
ncbi:uncharacterized protein V6R79_018797 [Siganus canaliculatus]